MGDSNHTTGWEADGAEHPELVEAIEVDAPPERRGTEGEEDEASAVAAAEGLVPVKGGVEKEKGDGGGEKKSEVPAPVEAAVCNPKKMLPPLSPDPAAPAAKGEQGAGAAPSVAMRVVIGGKQKAKVASLDTTSSANIADADGKGSRERAGGFVSIPTAKSGAKAAKDSAGKSSDGASTASKEDNEEGRQASGKKIPSYMRPTRSSPVPSDKIKYTREEQVMIRKGSSSKWKMEMGWDKNPNPYGTKKDSFDPETSRLGFASAGSFEGRVPIKEGTRDPRAFAYHLESPSVTRDDSTSGFLGGSFRVDTKRFFNRSDAGKLRSPVNDEQPLYKQDTRAEGDEKGELGVGKESESKGTNRERLLENKNSLLSDALSETRRRLAQAQSELLRAKHSSKQRPSSGYGSSMKDVGLYSYGNSQRSASGGVSGSGNGSRGKLTGEGKPKRRHQRPATAAQVNSLQYSGLLPRRDTSNLSQSQSVNVLNELTSLRVKSEQLEHRLRFADKERRRLAGQLAQMAPAHAKCKPAIRKLNAVVRALKGELKIAREVVGHPDMLHHMSEISAKNSALARENARLRAQNSALSADSSSSSSSSSPSASSSSSPSSSSPSSSAQPASAALRWGGAAGPGPDAVAARLAAAEHVLAVAQTEKAALTKKLKVVEEERAMDAKVILELMGMLERGEGGAGGGGGWRQSNRGGGIDGVGGLVETKDYVRQNSPSASSFLPQKSPYGSKKDLSPMAAAALSISRPTRFNSRAPVAGVTAKGGLGGKSKASGGVGVRAQKKKTAVLLADSSHSHTHSSFKSTQKHAKTATPITNFLPAPAAAAALAQFEQSKINRAVRLTPTTQYLKALKGGVLGGPDEAAAAKKRPIPLDVENPALFYMHAKGLTLTDHVLHND